MGWPLVYRGLYALQAHTFVIVVPVNQTLSMDLYVFPVCRQHAFSRACSRIPTVSRAIADADIWSCKGNPCVSAGQFSALRPVEFMTTVSLDAGTEPRLMLGLVDTNGICAFYSLHSGIDTAGADGNELCCQRKAIADSLSPPSRRMQEVVTSARLRPGYSEP